MASEKKNFCHYEILGVDRESSTEEIRSAYKKLALQRHPDKLVKTGITLDQATASFQELVNAYEVLSDPKERSWYDSHRSQILFSDPKSSSSSGKVPNLPDLFSYFSNSVFSGFGDTGKGFYKVYGDLFGRVYGQEVWFAKKLGLGEGAVKVAPLVGNLESYYVQVSAFYDYWLGFSSVMDFSWADEHDVREGGDRKERRLMEEENNKLRKKAKREFNDTVRRLAEYVKKRDKRVIDMQMKKKMEQEKKREKERVRKEEEARAKLEKARMYQEPEWAKVEDVEGLLEEEEDDTNKDHGEELYCVVCKKKFKSDKQWQNHEKSKKHRQKVAEMKNEYGSEDEGQVEAHVSAHSEGVDTMESNNHRNQAAKREGVQKSKKEVVRVKMGGDAQNAIPDSIGSEVPFVEDKSNAQDASSQMPVEVDLNIRRDPLLDKGQNTTNQWFKRKSAGKGVRNTNVRDTENGDANTNTRNASNWKAQKGLIVVRGHLPRPPPQNLLDQLLLQLDNLDGVIKARCWVPTVALLSCAFVLLYYYYY